MVFGRETGENGTKHLQGYIYWKNARTLAATRKCVSERAHFEVSKGNAEQNKIYCSKEDPEPFEKGTMPQQGTRNDIKEVLEIIRGGGTMRSVLDIARTAPCLRVAEYALKYLEPGRSWKPEVEWFWGPTGSGKTKTAQEEMGEDPAPYWVYDGKWWCGYDGHENVIWDEFRADQIKFTRLLRLLDRYPIAVETKGGQRQLKFKKIIITCCKHPRDVYDKGDEEVAQLLRRIDKVRHFVVWPSI